MTSLTTRRLFVTIFILAIFAMAVRETLDPDMWWHLRTGQVIVEDGIPRQDPYSFTLPGSKWITHEWLSEVVMWLVYRVTGLPGLILLFAALIALTFWLVYRRSPGKPYLAAFLGLLSAVATAPFWGVRPQIFNMLFAAFFVFLLEGYRQGQVKKRQLWFLPVTTLFWANLHSGYLLGVAIIVAYLTGLSLERVALFRSNRQKEWAPVTWLALMALLSFLIAAANPNGLSLWIYPFFTLGSGAMQAYIQEWHSPDFHQPIFWPFAALLFLGIVSMIAGRRRPSVTSVILFCGTAVAGLMSSRNIPIFAIVSTPIISRYLLAALDGTPLFPWLSGRVRSNPSSASTMVNWLLLLVMLIVAAIWAAGKIQGNDLAIASRYPVQAVDYLEQNNLIGERMYNSYNWGGYLIWRGLPVFVDGRADVYGDDFLHHYRLTFDMTERWQIPLDDYAVRHVLIERGSPLANLLGASEAWNETYSDEVAAIFSRVER